MGGQHFGVSEFYVENDAQLCFSMVGDGKECDLQIHVWCNAYVAWPVSAAIVEDNGVFYSNYVCLQPVVKVKVVVARKCNIDVSCSRSARKELGGEVLVSAASKGGNGVGYRIVRSVERRRIPK